ncbi:sigma-54-dependent transcriptional regulator [Salidesulfovibrio onnuriiensis]|uniref:sigma-54-dependent transcriptional regulator n=1 Tax=Salidesulfovibrio onnuriiensis TaxID=2583823 RepID=UPI0011C6F51C|nr:sigma-54 dependent transcriptional regulator [Salidesulfovibrio onnuriiensis]
MSKVLIIDDDPQVCETIESLVTRQSHEAVSAQTLTRGLEKLNEGGVDVVFLDVRLPDGNGMDILPDIAGRTDAPEVIILTGKGDPDGAELAIQQGVWDYLLKPSSVREITLTLGRALKYRDQKFGQAARDALNLDKVVGESAAMKAVFRLMAQAAGSDTNVLISGETGTGKELMARTIHRNSARAEEEFVVVDCASLTESLVESTLFGHKKGSFTGAQSDQIGLVKLADKGTLFLDEVGEMPLSLQKSFLRVLQERTFRPVGDSKEQTSNFRLISATNRNLDAMVEKGEFRSDLLFRLKTFSMHLPPLRQRLEDLRTLNLFQVSKLCRKYGIPEKGFGSDFLSTLESYDWPGNVRELFNILERAVVAAGEEKTLYSMHLPRDLRIKVAREQVRKITGSDVEATGEDMPIAEGARRIGQEIFSEIFDHQLPALREFKSMAEKAYLSELIRQCGSDTAEVLKVSGLSRSHFYALLKKYSISM